MFLQKNYITFFFYFSFIYIGNAQNMQQGFSFLESGNYKEAVPFFNHILKTHPDNKTARLCYGRAIGLNGNSEKAVALFTKLLNDFPNDFEVKLNYAEALLWNKEFISAESFYKKLLKENEQSFPALLGYANTLSNLKKYDKALLYVNKALEVQPKNNNALISKKYIRLGLANENIKNQEYKISEKILTKIFLDFPNDKETLLNLGNLYVISNEHEKAKKIYETLGQKETLKPIALNGLALVKHLTGKNKEALEISKKAMLLPMNDISIKKQTQERYIQALIWNKKFKLAAQEINDLLGKKGAKNWILALRASLNIYKNDFKKSLIDYEKILKSDSTSFDGNLGKANALKALNNFDDAYKSATKTLSFYENQKDAVNFIAQLDQKFTPFVETKTSYSFDNGKNKANAYVANFSFPFSSKGSVLGNYTYRTTRNSITNIKANTNSFLVGLNYQILPNVVFKSALGFTNTNTSPNSYTQFLSNISLNIKPFKLQNLTLKYKRDLQDFNADLLNREIVQNNLIVNYSVNTNFNLGSFTQYYHTRQSDDNIRNLLFTSLYYTILENPSLKTGINYQNITFKDQVPTIYFSPEKFHFVELFFNIIRTENSTKEKQWFYELTGATGFQFIANNDKQSTYRIQGKLGYKIAKNTLVNLYGTQSNIASTTAAGFTFTEIGFRFKWYFMKQPFFKK